jgi:hypothetical protein
MMTQSSSSVRRIDFSNNSGKTNYDVTYRVYGTIPQASIVFTNGFGITVRMDKVDLPWEITFSTGGSRILQISAVGLNGDGSITCEILVDNELVRRQTSEGEVNNPSWSLSHFILANGPNHLSAAEYEIVK